MSQAFDNLAAAVLADAAADQAIIQALADARTANGDTAAQAAADTLNAAAKAKLEAVAPAVPVETPPDGE